MPKAIPAKVWDAIEEQAEQRGGVGAGRMFYGDGEPVCAYALAYAGGGIRVSWWWRLWRGGVEGVLLNAERRMGFHYNASDRVVWTLAARTPGALRVPFSAWAKRMNLKRGK